MKNSLLATALMALVVPGIALAGQAPKPRISMASARAAALKIAHGEVTSAEYEHEGAGWRYSFDIRQNDKHIQEIGIDAMTGKVVENKSEGLNDKD